MFLTTRTPADVLYKLFIEPLRSFYATERKVLLMFKIHQPQLWYPAAFACFGVAVAAAAIGILLTTASLVNAQQHPTLHAIGLISLIISLPVLILGGHCLDLNDRTREKSRAAKTHLQA